MRLRYIAGLATAASVVLGLPVPTVAVADTTTIYVSNAKGANCSDAGTGTQQQPFCTIQAAADAAQPGQTVQVAPGPYHEQVTLTHSGTADQPITFLGGRLRDGVFKMPRISQTASGQGLQHAFVLNGVHDVKISGFYAATEAEGVLLNGSSRVTVDGNRFQGGSMGSGAPAAVHVTANSSATTISRNFISNYALQSVLLDAGTTGTVVTTNAIDNPFGGGGVQATDAPGTVVTSNTISSTCGPAVGLLGDSSKSVVENNVLAATSFLVRTSSLCDKSAPKLTVSAASVSGTTVDYNLANPLLGQPVYNWSGTDYPTATDFAKAVPGQGTHDLTADPQYRVDGSLLLGDRSPAIDSADANAPGELDTDVQGYHRIDDPYVANTGTGVGYYDRGAFELTTSAAGVGLTADFDRVPSGSTVTFTAHPQSWSPITSYRYDFRDGTDPVTTTDLSVPHTYTTTGTFSASVVATMQNGDTSTSSFQVIVNPPGPLATSLKVSPYDGPPLTYRADPVSSSPWAITTVTYDWGDGSAPNQEIDHTYSHEGDYTVKVTVQDAGGRTTTASQLVQVRYQPSTYYPMTPYRILDTRQTQTTLGPGRTLTFAVPMPPGLQEHPNAVVLNVTAVANDAPGYLTVYPSGTDRPTTSNVNFTAGQAVPNLVTVPVGADGEVSVYNGSGDTDVVVDMFGAYSANLPTAGPTQNTGARYTAQAPVRLLDTRSGNALTSGGETSIQISGQHNVPADATAVVLNVTATEPDHAGYFTVYPSGTMRTRTSNVNFIPGQTVANQVIVPIGPDGSVKLANLGGNTHAVVDLFGYYSPNGDSQFVPTTPRRLLDTRPNSPFGPGEVRPVATGAPAGATGAVVNLTATEPTGYGYLTAWADGAAKPGTSNLNFVPGQTVPNHVTTPLGANGSFDVGNFGGNTQVVADLFGYFVKQ